MILLSELSRRRIRSINKLIRVGRTGFRPTPLIDSPKLAKLVGLPEGARLWVKDETHNVAGSHKARHLFGLLLHRVVDERLGAHHHGDLAIASCGNAAIAAATIANAAGLRLKVFIPTWTSAAIETRLADLGADVLRCERRDGELGDPAYLRFLEALDAGDEAFSVQGTVAPEALDGGRTIGWEIADQLAEHTGTPARLDAVSLQVGGGAFASSLLQGLDDAAADGSYSAPLRTHTRPDSPSQQHRAIAPTQTPTPPPSPPTPPVPQTTQSTLAEDVAQRPRPNP